jgi:hypothetical protein
MGATLPQTSESEFFVIIYFIHTQDARSYRSLTSWNVWQNVTLSSNLHAL